MAPPARSYTGPDRRQRAVACLRPPTGQTLTVVAATAMVGGLVVPLLLARSMSAESDLSTFVIVRVVASMLITSAGVMSLVRWRMTGEATLAITGSAGVLFGTVGVIPALLRLSHPGSFIPYARAVNSLLVIFILTCALVAPAVTADIRPLRLIGLGLLTTLLADSLLIRYADRPRAEFLHGGVPADLSIAVTAIWTLLASASFVRGRLRRQPRWVWLGLMAIAAAFAEAARAASYADMRRWLLASACLLVTAGATWCLAAGHELLVVMADQGNSLMSLNDRLSAVSERLDESKARDEERVHDARAALCAVQAAISTMTLYYERLEEESRSGLERAVDAELGRLRHLLDNVAADDFEYFDLATAIRPVVTAQRAHGVQIDLQVGSFCWVRGRPADTATVVQTLLENARRYAPGSPIVVRISRIEGRVVLAVEDQGPGVPIEERERIFCRGVRGSAGQGVTGSGLGLFIAARLMNDQLGRIGVYDGVGGGASFVLTFAQPSDMAAQPVQPPALTRFDNIASLPDVATA
jgi:signal transduction histidine kinase